MDPVTQWLNENPNASAVDLARHFGASNAEDYAHTIPRMFAEANPNASPAEIARMALSLAAFTTIGGLNEKTGGAYKAPYLSYAQNFLSSIEGKSNPFAYDASHAGNVINLYTNEFSKKKSGLGGSLLGSLAGIALAPVTGGSSLLMGGLGGAIGGGIQGGNLSSALQGGALGALAGWGVGALGGAGAGTGAAGLGETAGLAGLGSEFGTAALGYSGLPAAGSLGTQFGTAALGSGAGSFAGGLGATAGTAGGFGSFVDSLLSGLNPSKLGVADVAKAGINYLINKDSAKDMEAAAREAAMMSDPLNQQERFTYQDQLAYLLANPEKFYETNPVVKAQLDLAKNQFLANSAKMGVGGTQFSNYLKDVQNVAAGTFNDQANLLSTLSGLQFPGAQSSSNFMQGMTGATGYNQEALGSIGMNKIIDKVFGNMTFGDFSLG